ncbi:MAG: hypothetical protein IH886_05220 [Nitrospinae bacterium]|nr:hypothetical protein [Nitrospinota bacterium]
MLHDRLVHAGLFPSQKVITFLIPMTAPRLDCPCQRTSIVDFENLLPTLEGLRRQCPALKDIFLPEEFWNDFKTADQFGGRTLDDSHHRSILLLSMERGYLGKITSPIHKFILYDHQICPRVKINYTKDLHENWLFKPDPLERHTVFKIYMGKLMELEFADWLENKAYKITGLEAWGGKADISANKDNIQYTFEVKYIGQENVDFEKTWMGLGGTIETQRYSPYVASNYLLFKVYEAAKQLEKHQDNGQKVVTIIIDSSTCHRFQIQLKDDWINWWENPKFFNDLSWTEFIQGQKIKANHPKLESELGEVLKKLSSILILESNGFKLKEIIITQNPYSKCS